MRKSIFLGIIISLAVSQVFADTFGEGENEFTLDFVVISGDASSANGTNVSGVSPGEPGLKYFADPGADFRISIHQITNEQWEKFVNSHGAPTGSPANAYDNDNRWPGANVPADRTSWYEAAQFVNWLNESSGYQAAYNFSGTKGTADYTFELWSSEQAWGGTNLYRHKNAAYFLPNEDEWVKAAYWNGSSLQTYATKNGDTLHQGNGINGTGWNYYDGGYATDPPGPWDVGSGSQELNGTYDMMGNLSGWLENPYDDAGYGADSPRCIRGGGFGNYADYLSLNASNCRNSETPHSERNTIGFRVASVSEPVYQEPEPDCPEADLTGDCFVDFEDFYILASQWLTGSR